MGVGTVVEGEGNGKHRAGRECEEKSEGLWKWK